MRWPDPSFFRLSTTSIVVLIILLSIFASSSAYLPPNPVRAASPTQSATIIDFAFQPAHLNITTGTEVIWKNNGNTQHTVTSSPQTNTTQTGTPLISSGPLNPGQNFSYIFYKHGVYPIQCAFHPSTMNGWVNVTGTDLQPPPSTVTQTTDYTPYIIAGAIVAAAVAALFAAFFFIKGRKKPPSPSQSGPPKSS